jgi:RNA-directed DNA polymerase
VGDQLTRIIDDNGFKINPAKTRVRSKGSRLEVTGVTVNRELNVSRKLIRQIRAMLHAWKKFGLDAAQTQFDLKHEGEPGPSPPIEK